MVGMLPGGLRCPAARQGPRTLLGCSQEEGVWSWGKEGCHFMFLAWALWLYVLVFREKDERV